MAGIQTDTIPLKYGLSLTSGTELPRLAPICQLSFSWKTRPVRVPIASHCSKAAVRLSAPGMIPRVRNGGLRYANRDNRATPD